MAGREATFTQNRFCRLDFFSIIWIMARPRLYNSISHFMDDSCFSQITAFPLFSYSVILLLLQMVNDFFTKKDHKLTIFVCQFNLYNAKTNTQTLVNSTYTGLWAIFMVLVQSNHSEYYILNFYMWIVNVLIQRSIIAAI